MSKFLGIYANLNQNPITAILTQFRDQYTNENAKTEIATLLLGLVAYTSCLDPNDEVKMLRKQLCDISNDVTDNNNNHVTKLQPLVNAILQNQDEAKVFKIAVELAQELAYKPSGTQSAERSFCKPTHSSITFTRTIAEASGFDKTVTSLTAALKNELSRNVIVDFDNFWKVLFLDKNWSDQTLNIWKCYNTYELKEIMLQKEDAMRKAKKPATKEQMRSLDDKTAEDVKLTRARRNTRSQNNTNEPEISQTAEKGKALRSSKRIQDQKINSIVHSKTMEENTLPESSRITRSQKSKKEAKNLEIIEEEDLQESSSRTRSHENKNTEEMESLTDDEWLENSQNSRNKINTKESKKKITLLEIESEEISKTVYANKILEENMTKNEMWDWLDFFRDKFLNQLTDQFSKSSGSFPSIIKDKKGSQLRSKYFRSSRHCPIKGTDRNYQADFLTKRINLPSADEHEWSDVRVLGEFTKQPSLNQRSQKFFQLSRLALQVFYTQPLRHFVHGFCLFKTDFELWVFNRSGAFSSGLLSLSDDKEKLVRAICSYLLMSDHELGIDTSIQQVDERSFVSVYDEKLGKKKEFDINPDPFFMAGTLVTRGTTCFETSDQSKVVKYSWVRIPGKSEIDFLQHAQGIEGVVEYVLADAICKIGDHLKDLNFSKAKYLNSTDNDPEISRAEGAVESKIPLLRDRELRRIVITPRGHSLRSSKTILEFLMGIRDVVVAHRRLYVEKNILHGDISDGNIILATVGDKTQGMLIDLDHAQKVEKTRGEDIRLCLTGTMKFMAIERLYHAANYRKSITRTYHHDLESIFYVFILGCMTYERRKNSKVSVELHKWCTECIASNYHEKKYSVWDFEEKILKKFSTNFFGLKDLASELRTILFGEHGNQFKSLKDDELEYKEMIKAFNNTIDDIRDGKILNKFLAKGMP